jgi:hypothetical protein
MTELIRICQDAISNSQNNHSILPDSILEMEGMSSKKIRHLLSNIGGGIFSYIEVGVWKGSTFLSTLYGHKGIEAVAIDNWSQFNGPKDTFFANLWENRTNLPQSPLILSKDLKDAKLRENHYECILYDGDHSEQAQYDGVMHLKQFAANTFIYIVDDFDWANVRHGTNRGIQDAGLQVLFWEELHSNGINDAETYWNGMLVSVLRKPN